MKKCCGQLPHVEEKVGDDQKEVYSIYCPRCDRTTWFYHDIKDASKAWDCEKDMISALTHSELIHTGKNKGRKWAHTVVLILAVGGVMTFLWECLF